MQNSPAPSFPCSVYFHSGPKGRGKKGQRETGEGGKETLSAVSLWFCLSPEEKEKEDQNSMQDEGGDVERAKKMEGKGEKRGMKERREKKSRSWLSSPETLSLHFRVFSFSFFCICTNVCQEHQREKSADDVSLSLSFFSLFLKCLF